MYYIKDKFYNKSIMSAVDTNTNSKFCRKCGERKALHEFYRVGKNSKYLSSRCKRCHNYELLEKYAAEEKIGRRRTKFELNPELVEQVQQCIDTGMKLSVIAKTQHLVSYDTLKKALASGVLTRFVPVEPSEDNEESNE